MGRLRIVQGARSAEDISGRCESLNTAIGEYTNGNPFLKPVATFSFSTHGALYRNMLSTMCIESSPLHVNSSTIYMGTAIREYELYF